jgi:hypothetical protein
MILDVQTIPKGFILRDEELFFDTDQLSNSYEITSPVNFLVDTTNGLIVFDITVMSCDGVQYNTPQEFITALGL